MTDNQNDKYISYTRMAWAIYCLITVIIIVVLVLFVAQDNEEMFFYGIMPAAAAYVFRPMNKPFSKLIFKYTGASHPTEQDEPPQT
ncbi:MAG: hypothetical protein OEY06_11475 [Gammaproteobacteria bacterium]|nr:hypothetical protein [Gammaproteobacteria bacterium]